MNFAPFPVTLRQLQYLVAVADRKSFRKAAEACHVSQPSLSEQIALAESALGVKLFERSQRGVVPTAAGQALLPSIRAICHQAFDLSDAAKRFADPFAGRLRVGAIPTVAPYLLPALAPLLRATYPKLSFLWTEDKTHVLVDRLRRGELDAAILALEADIGELSHVVLGKDSFVLATGADHPLAKSNKPARLSELDGHPVLLLDEGHCFRRQVLSFCERVGVEEAGFRATSLATLVQMTAGGEGVTLLPTLAVAVENRLGSLVVRRFAPKAPARTLALCWRTGSALAPTLDPVGQTLRKAYAALADA
jgi:LysR family hydrogen peroxide-inducible transcriptional activator